jgi:formylglycine-generating enzyme required for sulfatase activity
LSIYSGGILQLAAIASFADGASGDVTSEAIWSNSPGRAGTVNKTGLFTAGTDSIGMETVRADYQGQTASIQIEVTKRAATLTIWPVRATVQSAGTIQFVATAEFQDASRAFVTNKTAWSLTPGAAATIDSNGVFRAKPGITGQEKVVGKFQALSTESEVRVQSTIEIPFEMVTIPAGSFVMGDDNGRSDEKPAHEVFVDAFQIGKHEVTNAQYVAYLNQALAAGEIIYESFIVSGKRGPFAFLIYTKLCHSFEFPDEFTQVGLNDLGEIEFRAKPGFENYPVVRMNWYGAAAFCAFYGLRLPTEAEWEKASRGGQQLAYGTQDGTISHDLANYTGTAGRDVFEGLAPVGSFPPNPYGLYDMSGNAAEYVFDLYDANYYANSPSKNPMGPGPAMPLGQLPGSPIWRGGSWIHPESACRSAFRGTIAGQAEHCFLSRAMVGFRVARSLP